MTAFLGITEDVEYVFSCLNFVWISQGQAARPRRRDVSKRQRLVRRVFLQDPVILYDFWILKTVQSE
ncbi:hypothetical protein A6J39_009355 [Legionella anisa]|uniref:Uncharacterized protein n=1 Tax=Legionella anisa TaxID=28082 RepID=A0AAX0WSU2_9GAMM|nr:hypothetical protein DLD14_13115 [Legionella anisa]PNL61404.1 hypothetical protein A6J39_009355 [Legionella anisa]